ncbi:hypothetical protein D6777_02620 [Candidatus Woesearchaeota archaeon]|nr:MAG: hypothetical protein D6777_02620 [Candidatus Woesearchaeota archaeon]
MTKWINTVLTRKRLEDKIQDDTYKGRPLIFRDSRINGGVYLGSNRREALVVDFDKDSYLSSLYEQAKEKCFMGRKFVKQLVLPTVYSLVQNSMPERLPHGFLKYSQFKDDVKVYLGFFIKNGKGCCRHRALATAALLEKFADEGYIRGKASVDRNIIGKDSHAWCRYTAHDGTVVILDTQFDYLGPLNTKPWDYMRKSDKSFINGED